MAPHDDLPVQLQRNLAAFVYATRLPSHGSGRDAPTLWEATAFLRTLDDAHLDHWLACYCPQDTPADLERRLISLRKQAERTTPAT